MGKKRTLINSEQTQASYVIMLSVTATMLRNMTKNYSLHKDYTVDVIRFYHFNSFNSTKSFNKQFLMH